MSSGVQRTVRGTIVMTGAAMVIDSLGFSPKKVVLRNRTDGGSLTWHAPMPDASGHLTITDGTHSYIAVAGITPGANGFTIGANAEINGASDVVDWEASE